MSWAREVNKWPHIMKSSVILVVSYLSLSEWGTLVGCRDGRISRRRRFRRRNLLTGWFFSLELCKPNLGCLHCREQRAGLREPIMTVKSINFSTLFLTSFRKDWLFLTVLSICLFSIDTEGRINCKWEYPVDVLWPFSMLFLSLVDPN